MQFSRINVLISVLSGCIFWIYNREHLWTVNKGGGNQIRVFQYRSQEIGGKVQLYSEDLLQWIAGMNDAQVANDPIHLSLLTVLRVFCAIDIHPTSTRLFRKCCMDSEQQMDNHGFFWCFTLIDFIGQLPVARDTRSNSSVLSTRPPDYKLSAVYMYEPSATNQELRCYMGLHQRESMYQLLLKWIKLAGQHKIVWWLTYGSLLGSIRDNEFIPYDHDVDVAVLGSHEDTIRKVADSWKDATFERPFVIARQCRKEVELRLSCQGFPFRTRPDKCMFCTPIARILSSPNTYLDVFPVDVKLAIDMQDTNKTQVGLLDKAVDPDWKNSFSYPLDYVFPLSTCTFMGLQVPCPRRPDLILSQTYGSNYMKPLQLCDPQSGVWRLVN